ncbi:MAG: hypothetical protein M3128_06900 [Verrucomicrobiota bacterium]|nr:hypothetical protein [Verrucomicrobiota bacterium]
MPLRDVTLKPAVVELPGADLEGQALLRGRGSRGGNSAKLLHQFIQLRDVVVDVFVVALRVEVASKAATFFGVALM